MKNAFDELINRLNTTEERISDLEDMLIETSQIEKQREKDGREKREQISKNCGILIEGVTSV